MKLVIAMLAVSLSVAGAQASQANSEMTPRQITQCLDETGHGSIATAGNIYAGLGFTPSQTKDVSARLAGYLGFHYQGLGGLGLTNVQVSTINARLAAWKASWKPIGWPCPVFTNKPRSEQFLRQLLLDNGFRATMQFYNVSTRQLRVSAIRDGIYYTVDAVKSGPNEMNVHLSSPRGSGGSNETSRFTTPFVP